MRVIIAPTGSGKSRAAILLNTSRCSLVDADNLTSFRHIYSMLRLEFGNLWWTVRAHETRKLHLIRSARGSITLPSSCILLTAETCFVLEEDEVVVVLIDEKRHHNNIRSRSHDPSNKQPVDWKVIVEARAHCRTWAQLNGYLVARSFRDAIAFLESSKRVQPISRY